MSRPRPHCQHRPRRPAPPCPPRPPGAPRPPEPEDETGGNRRPRKRPDIAIKAPAQKTAAQAGQRSSSRLKSPSSKPETQNRSLPGPSPNRSPRLEPEAQTGTQEPEPKPGTQKPDPRRPPRPRPRPGRAGALDKIRADKEARTPKVAAERSRALEDRRMRELMAHATENAKQSGEIQKELARIASERPRPPTPRP